MTAAPVLALALAAAVAPPKPQRIVSLNQCTDQLLLALVPPERIASVTWLSRDPETSVMAGAARRVGVNHGKAEEVVRDRPDLVLTGVLTTPATRLLLRRLHYPVVEVPIAESLDDIRAAARQVARAVGEPARGEALVARLDARVAELRRDPGPPLRVAAWDAAGFSASPGSLYDTVLRLAGARNVYRETGRFGGGAPGVETLLATAPTLLVRSGAPAPKGRNDLGFHPLVRRYWAGRTVTVSQKYTICGTPMTADAAASLRTQLRAAAARNPAPPVFASAPR